MHQAGRYMNEYHTVKNKFNSFMEMCKNSEAVTEITMLPIKKFNFDAGIIFSDILIILEALHIEVEFIPNKGPVVNNKNLVKVFDSKNIGIDHEKLYPVYQSIKAVKKIFKLKGRPKSNPLIVHYYDLNSAIKDVEINQNFLKLYKKFCPGPITFVLKKIKIHEAPKYILLNKKLKSKSGDSRNESL